MNRTINITIRDKIAKADKTLYICGNSDFVIHFDFDDEWAEHDVKTARFISGDGKYQDVVFRGTECPVPVISDTYMIKVGVFAGDLHTTTPAIVSAKKSILCESGVPADPAPDVYSQIMEQINAGMLRGEQGEQGIPGPAGPAGEPGKDAEPYTLPTASETVKGGVKVGAGLQMDGDVLGIKNAEWEQIEKITVREENLTSIQRTAFPDGTAYKLAAAKVVVKMRCPVTVGYGTRVDFKNNNSTLATMVVTMITNNSSNTGHVQTGLFQITPVNGLYEVVGAKGSQGGEMQLFVPPNANFQTASVEKKIDRIDYVLWDGRTLPVGTEIGIWGVRADA